jgi:DNA-binding transcriptional ArsR family regulator
MPTAEDSWPHLADLVKLLGKKAGSLLFHSCPEEAAGVEAHAAWRLLNHISRRLEELEGLPSEQVIDAARSLSLDRGLKPSGPYETAVRDSKISDLRGIGQKFAECDQDGTARFLWIELCEDALPLMYQSGIFPPSPADVAATYDSEVNGQTKRDDAETAGEAPALDDEDVRILRALAEQRPTLQTPDQIETGSRVSHRTISARLQSLRKDGLVQQPKGPKSGTAITKDGLNLLKKIDAANPAR